MPRDETVVSLAEIERRILTVRWQKVMLDSDLAHLYGVPTKRLNEQVHRNLGRFPPDFMFQLSTEEASALRSQIATSQPGRGGRRYLPCAFTEQGAIMAAFEVPFWRLKFLGRRGKSQPRQQRPRGS